MGASGYKKIKKMRIFLYFILILLLKKKKTIRWCRGRSTRIFNITCMARSSTWKKCEGNYACTKLIYHTHGKVQ